MQNKNVYILYTGGTIGMQDTEHGLQPNAGFLEQYLQESKIFSNPRLPKYHLETIEPLMDSANIAPKDWQMIADKIYGNYNEYDGFIVLHGTDTMAYSACALSFMLDNLSKPVIFTGSQIPLCSLRSDGIDNLVNSLIIAANYNIPEVCVYFNSLLLRGNRCKKIDSEGLMAFTSPNYPPLGKAGINIKIKVKMKHTLPANMKALQINHIKPQIIANIILFPGFSEKIIYGLIEQNIQGLIIQTYGSGNASSNPKLLEAIKIASSKNMVIVNCSQCLHGTVNMQSYATGQELIKNGVISGFDMTHETALTKLHYLLSNEKSIEKIKQQIQISLKGEMTTI